MCRYCSVVEFTLIYVNLWFLLTIQVEERGGKCIPVQCDHTNDEDVKYLFERVMDEQGRLDVLVNNAYEGISVSYCNHWKYAGYLQTYRAIRYTLKVKHKTPNFSSNKKFTVTTLGKVFLGLGQL